MELKKGALRKLPRDNRDFKAHKVLGLAPLQDLPPDFLFLGASKIKDQKTLDFCTGFASCAIAEDDFQIEFSPLWFFAQIKAITGDYKSWGADLRTACKASLKGFLPEENAPFKNDGSKDRDFLANPDSWPSELQKLAENYRMGSFLSVSGPHDTFDNFRSTIWKNKRAILTGCDWRVGWTYAKDGILTNSNLPIQEGHAFKLIVGWKTINGQPYLIIQNSWSDKFGDKGLFYMSREVTNAVFGDYGAFTFSTLNQYRAELLNKLTILRKLYELYVKIQAYFMKNLLPFALAIQEHEGYYTGSRSFRNMNPGNFRMTDYVKTLGATDKDKDGFAIFPTYEIGLEALKTFLIDCSKNRLRRYRNEMTLYEFFSVYAPASENDYRAYAEAVAKKLKVEPITKIKEIL